MSAHLNCEEIRISNSDIDVNFVHSSFPEYLSGLDPDVQSGFKNIGQTLE